MCVQVTRSYVTMTPPKKKKKNHQQKNQHQKKQENISDEKGFFFLTLCMAYNPDAIKGITIKHTQLLQGPSICITLKY